MSSAFVELLQKSNLDYLLTRKPFKVGSRSDDILFVSLINTKAKQLQVERTNHSSKYKPRFSFS